MGNCFRILLGCGIFSSHVFWGTFGILFSQEHDNDSFASLYGPVRLGIMVQGQGQALYSWFGHAGIVLSGPAKVLRSVAQQHQKYFVHAAQYMGEELLFDYGNFDAGDKDFILDLLTGKLNYYKSYKNFQRYKEKNAIYRKRGLDVYWLNLDSEAKQKFVQILFRDTNPKNRVYKYDFYFDNCLTRIRDQLNEVFDGRLKEQITRISAYNIRQILRREIGDKFWGLLLLEYLQGAQIDQKYSRWDSIFFPSYMPILLQELQIPGKNQALLVQHEKIFPFRLNELQRLHTYKYFYQNVWAFTAYVVLSFLIVFLCYYYKIAFRFKRWSKVIYYGLTVIISILLGGLSGVIWLANILHNFDVALENALILLGSPFLLLQLPALLLLSFRSLRDRIHRQAKIFILWNWRIHTFLAFLVPVWAWLYSFIWQKSMQNILLPWAAVLPVLLIIICLSDKIKTIQLVK